MTARISQMGSEEERKRRCVRGREEEEVCERKRGRGGV